MEGLEYLNELQDRAKKLNAVDRNLLKEYMRSQLPNYMIPAQISVVQDLPLTSNGKIDRKLLTENTKLPTFNYVEDGVRSAQTETQRQLLSLWSKVLDLEVSNIGANFFTLGGHSLLAAQLISMIRSTMHLNLPLRAIFDAPTIEQLAQKIEELAGNSISSTEVKSSVSNNRNTRLSFAQERLWFISQLQPNSPLYNVPISFVLEGSLNKPVFARAFQELLASHEAFRSTITLEGEQPSLMINAEAPDILQFIDGKVFADDEQWLHHIDASLREEAIKPFDVENEPLIRARLIEVSANRNVFFINVHHFIWDGWSRTVFLEELGKRYSAIIKNNPLPIGTKGKTYSEFANWQREYLANPALEHQADYWRTKLSGAPDCLSLPTDYKRPAQLSYQGKVIKSRLPQETLIQLRKLGEQRGVTLFMLLLTAYKALLHRLTTQDDLVVGVPIANRHYNDVEKTIGMFVNTVAIRSQCLPDLRFCDFLEAVKANTLDAYDHQDIPFDRVVDACQVKREINKHPIFQTMFDMQNENEWRLDLPGVKTEFFEVDTQIARFDLLLAVKEDRHGLELSFEYSTELFDEKSIYQFSDYFAVLLQAVAKTPELELESIPLQTRQLPLQRTLTAKSEDTVVSLFKQQVQANPEAISLRDRGRSVTYAELDAKSSELADYLQIKGVTHETPVGVLLRASSEAILTILAILKAGGMYVPIDSDYPSERITQILSDSKALYVITDNGSLHHSQGFDGEVIYLTSIDDLPYTEGEHLKQVTAITKEDLAYAIYTSGSTGSPKGVCIEHQSIIRLVKENGFLDIHTDDRVGLGSSIAFDAATFEIWGALLNGATLVILDKETMLDPRSLSFVIREESVSVMWMTSSLFNQHVSANQAIFHSLRALIIGGEALSVPHVKKLLDSGQGPEKLINGYGPTENTTFSTTYEISKHKGNFVRGVPIGRPIGNSFALILDKQLNPCPVGIAGEIYLGGQGLARGYL
ncbi:non-ribosomal peptide synthetase [Photobacterium leiognathi]|uniref:non-ribosomal peptide synthetase n=1 Tax=Photobacterium leiognathi TaxID=553611 RepID=UPI00273A2148|nr:condensation domain-containing protein [Photobacterium leiognathi]